MEFKIQGSQIKSYRNIAPLIRLHVVCGNFTLQGPTPEQLQRDHIAHKPKFMWPFTEKAGHLLIQSNVLIESVYQSRFKQPM